MAFLQPLLLPQQCCVLWHLRLLPHATAIEAARFPHCVLLTVFIEPHDVDAAPVARQQRVQSQPGVKTPRRSSADIPGAPLLAICQRAWQGLGVHETSG